MFGASHPKAMNMWLLMSSMVVISIAGRGGEKFVCANLTQVSNEA